MIKPETDMAKPETDMAKPDLRAPQPLSAPPLYPDSTPILSETRDLLAERFVHQVALADLHSPLQFWHWLEVLGLAQSPNWVLCLRLEPSDVRIQLGDKQKFALRAQILTHLQDYGQDTLAHWQEENECLVLRVCTEDIDKVGSLQAATDWLQGLDLPLGVRISLGLACPVENPSQLSGAMRAARIAALRALQSPVPVLHVDDLDTLAQEIQDAAAETSLEVEMRGVRRVLAELRHPHRQRAMASLEEDKRILLERLVALVHKARKEGIPGNHPQVSDTRVLADLLQVPDDAGLTAWIDVYGWAFVEAMDKAAEQHRSHTVARAVQYISAHLEEDLSLDTVAGHCAVSPFYLSHLFRKETDGTLTGFIKKARMERAMVLLADNSLTVADVAYRVGYQDPNYFSKSFRAYVGRSPSDFRKRS
ncbi:AraC family transcriptional regulator [Alicyclobacillaceae bacterium I2511]|nr:AraC family transcriptional regulator [Alicyclobacillaceae bacterium I2511]